MTNSLLEVTGLVKTYGRRKVVNGVSFHIQPGEVVGLLGPNGAGKTTSFRMTTGMVPPDQGKVVFNGKVVTDWPMYKRARLGLGYLSQESSIFRKLSVEQNILAILEAIPGLRSLDGKKPSNTQRHQITDDKLTEFGLQNLKKSLASTLSGGERRRLEIARCLATEPLLILLDEPFTGIDPITISDIQVIIRNLCEQGIAILITDHNVRETLKITDRSYVITDGKVVAEGTPNEIVRNQTVISRYLGENFVADHQGKEMGPCVGAGHSQPMLTLPPVQQVHTATPSATLEAVMHHEQIFALIEGLRTEQKPNSERELNRMGKRAIPQLLEALERRDHEIRRLAFTVLKQIIPGVSDFDPYAPEMQRRVQIDRLREMIHRAVAA